MRMWVILGLLVVAMAVGVLLYRQAPGGAEMAVAEGTMITVYKSPYCGCCGQWVAYLRQRGMDVTVVEKEDMDPIKKMAGVPESLGSCHTAMVGGDVVEGHVPISAIGRMLSEKPEIRGIALPGMPTGSPGMPGAKEEPFVIFAMAQKAGGAPSVYMKE